MKKNKGFGLLGIILIVVGVLVIGGGVYYLGTNNSEKNYDNSITQKVLSDDTIVSSRFGTVYPPYPNDVIDSFGVGLIMDSSNNITGYGIERVQTSDG